jgi:hypothetical protein
MYLITDNPERTTMEKNEPATSDPIVAEHTTPLVKAYLNVRDKVATQLFQGRGLTGRKLRRATASVMKKLVKEGAAKANAAKAVDPTAGCVTEAPTEIDHG